MILELRKAGLDDAVEFRPGYALHPDIEIKDDLYLATLYGEQRLLMVMERSMDNSDGSEWVRPYQTKTAVYYLEENLEWEHYRDLK